MKSCYLSVYNRAWNVRFQIALRSRLSPAGWHGDVLTSLRTLLVSLLCLFDIIDDTGNTSKPNTASTVSVCKVENSLSYLQQVRGCKPGSYLAPIVPLFEQFDLDHNYFRSYHCLEFVRLNQRSLGCGQEWLLQYIKFCSDPQR
jgi:hypothetical protein